jgi:hypothetical protein
MLQCSDSRVAANSSVNRWSSFARPTRADEFRDGTRRTRLYGGHPKEAKCHFALQTSRPTATLPYSHPAL